MNLLQDPSIIKNREALCNVISAYEIDFFEFVRKNNNGSNSSNPINQAERDFFDNKLIKCLEDHCINKKPVRPPPPSPVGSKNDLNENMKKEEENIEQENIQQENNIKIWVGLFNNTKKGFFRDFNDLTRDKNVFYKVMDELVVIPENLNEIFNHYKIGSDTFNVIMSYLIDKLGNSNDENALKFMDYIRGKNNDLYDEIIKNSSKEIVEKINKKRGGKKTRKNRKGKKRFTKRTMRSYKRSKTCRRNRKII